MINLHKFAFYLLGLIALFLIIAGLWLLIQGGSALYLVIGVLYALSLWFYLQKKSTALYVNFSFIIALVVWGCYEQGWGFLAL